MCCAVGGAKVLAGGKAQGPLSRCEDLKRGRHVKRDQRVVGVVSK